MRVGVLTRVRLLSDAIAISLSARSSEIELMAVRSIGELVASYVNPDDVLTLSTIHSAKGMEWRSVTILNMMERLYSIRSGEK